MYIQTIYPIIKEVLSDAVSDNRREMKIFSTDYFDRTKNKKTGRPGLALKPANLVAMVVTINQRFEKHVVTNDEMVAMADGQVKKLARKILSKYS